MINNYAFIVKGNGYNPKIHRTILDSGLFKTTIIGVSKEEEVFELCNELLENKIQVIELCGGFNNEWADKIMKHLDNKIPIGVASFSKIAENIFKSQFMFKN